MKISKAIIPAAGLGTRFLPYTKAIPKEMLPLLNKPAIEYIVRECLAAQLNQLYFITSHDKEAIKHYFTRDPQLSTFLQTHNKGELLQDLTDLIDAVHCDYIHQEEPLGLGHAIWLARHDIKEEYVAVLLPDDILISNIAAIEQLMQIAYQNNATVIAVQEVPIEAVPQYGIISIQQEIKPNLFHVASVVEKPSISTAPSRLAIIGRYVLSHKIFHALDEISPYAKNELQLTDAINHMLKNNETVLAYKIQGTRYDVGNPLGWLKAVIGIAMQDSTYSTVLKDYFNSL